MPTTFYRTILRHRIRPSIQPLPLLQHPHHHLHRPRPLGAPPNQATPQGYVTTPTTHTDPLGLHSYDEATRIALKPTIEAHQNMRKIFAAEVAADPIAKKFNVAVMRTTDGQTFYAMGAGKDLNPQPTHRIQPRTNRHRRCTRKNLSYDERLSFHAEQKLLTFAKENGLKAVEIQSIKEICPINNSKIKWNFAGTCYRALERAGLEYVTETTFMARSEIERIQKLGLNLKMMKGIL